MEIQPFLAPTARDRMKRLAEAYMAATRTSLSGLGRSFNGNPNILSRIVLNPEVGFNVTTYDEILQWLSNNWPDGAVWPEDIERPIQTAAAEAAE